MIPALLPSKNRACQLHLFLDSVAKHCPNLFKFYVLYSASDESFDEGYTKLYRSDIMDKLDITLVKEDDFVKQWWSFLDISVYDKFALFTDDCVMYHKPDIVEEDIDKYLEDDDVWSFILRLGFNTIVQNYWTGQKQHELKPLVQDEKMAKWNFGDYDFMENYGFPCTWDGGIFRKKHMLHVLDGTDFSNSHNPGVTPLHLIESYINTHRDRMPPKLCCNHHSSIVSLSYNITYPNADNYGKKFNYSLEFLNEIYMKEGPIDFDSLQFGDIQSCHYEIELL